MKYQVILNNKIYEVEVDETKNAIITNISDTNTESIAVELPSADTPKAKTASSASGEGMPVKAPMPGSILKINVEKGSSVKAGDVIMILEAMKMENEIVANKNGKITSITVSKGAAVDTDDVLAYID